MRDSVVFLSFSSWGYSDLVFKCLLMSKSWIYWIMFLATSIYNIAFIIILLRRGWLAMVHKSHP